MAGESALRRFSSRALALRTTLTIAMLASWQSGNCSTVADENIDLERLPIEQLLAMEVYGASKFAQKTSDAPSAVSIITAAEIKAFGWRTLADILSSIRGLHISNDRNYSYLGAAGLLRPGDYNTRFLLLVDGYRTNDSVYDQAAIGTEFILDLDLIERVEYVPGPGSSIYGANAFFGVINVITKRGRDVGGTEVALDGGSFGSRQGRVTHGWRAPDGTELLLAASAYRSRGQDLYFPEFDTPQTSHGVAEGLDYDRAHRFFVKAASGAFGLSLAHSDRNKGIPTASFSQMFNDPHSHTIDNQTLIDFTFRKQLSPVLDFSARAYAGRYAYYGDYAYDPVSPYVDRDGADARWWGGEVKWVSTRFDRHKLVFGAEYQHDYRRNQYNFKTESRDPSHIETSLDDHRHGHRIGVYLQDEITLRDNLLFNAGLRYDDNSSSGGITNPRMALIYKLNPATTGKILYGTAYRAPNAYEMFYEVPGIGGQKANLSLRPERIRSRELVLEHYFSPASRLTAHVFHNTITNLISLTSVAPINAEPATGDGEQLQFQNIDSVRGRGAGLEYEHLWTNGSKLRTSIVQQHTVDGTSGATLVNSPRRLMKLNLSTPLAHDAWQLALEGQYVGRRKTLAAEVGGYWLANLSLFSAHLVKGAELTASIYNLFGRRYADPGSEEHVQDAIAQDGRSFRIKLSYGF